MYGYYNLQIDGFVDGWMDVGWVDERIGGWMDGW
jgi:hypothetical protein